LASFFTSLVRDNTPTPDLDSHHAFNMAEPENFEEDLFADLYDDNDAAKAAPAPSSGGQPPAAPAQEAKPQIANGSQNNYGSGAADNAATQAAVDNASHGQEYEDDDDDVDFNLGGPQDTSPSMGHTGHHDEVMSPVTQGGFQKSSSKEDG